MKDHREIAFWCGLAGLFAVTVFVTLAAAAAIAPFIPGWHSSVVTSGSMSPKIRTGDVVVWQTRPADEIGPGSVLVFLDTTGERTMHRVVSVGPNGDITTRGDANPSNDSEPVHAANVRGAGRVLIPLVGQPRVLLHERRLLPLAAFVLSLIIACWLCRFAWAPEFDPWNAKQPNYAHRRAYGGPLWLSERGKATATTDDIDGALLPDRLRALLVHAAGDA